MGDEQSLADNLKLIDTALTGKYLTLEELAAKTGRPVEEITSVILTPEGQSRYPDKYGRARLGHGGEIVYFIAKQIGAAEATLPRMPSPVELAREALVGRLKEYGAPPYIIELAGKGRLRSVMDYMIEERVALIARKMTLDSLDKALQKASEFNGRPQVKWQM
ncbi:MAG TPA: hypothetical protein HA224_01635 [Nanoarchaeota archaeon]|nr:hypothetical protein [Nanoarchaeota archaeon]